MLNDGDGDDGGGDGDSSGGDNDDEYSDNSSTAENDIESDSSEDEHQCQHKKHKRCQDPPLQSLILQLLKFKVNHCLSQRAIEELVSFIKDLVSQVRADATMADVIARIPLSFKGMRNKVDLVTADSVDLCAYGCKYRYGGEHIAKCIKSSTSYVMNVLSPREVFVRLLEHETFAQLLVKSLHHELKEVSSGDGSYGSLYNSGEWLNFRELHGVSPFVLALKLSADGKCLTNLKRAIASKHGCNIFIAHILNLPLAIRNNTNLTRMLAAC